MICTFAPLLNKQNFLDMRKFLSLLLIFGAMQGQSQDFIVSTYSNTNGNTMAIGVADIDGDELPDIITTETYSLASEFYLHKNEGHAEGANFTKKRIFNDIYISGTPSLVDIDNDGDKDIVYTSALNNVIELLQNDGKGQFTKISLDISGSNIFKFMDMDNDGDLDIVGVNDSNRTLSLYTQQTNLKFVKKSLLPGNNALTDFALGDLDGDGLPEIVLSYRSFSSTQVMALENKGFNTISTKVIVKGKYSEIGKVKIEDLDKDGKNDIVIIDRYDLVVVKNNGNYTFADKVINPAEANVIIGADFADLTGDGEYDFVICSILKSFWLKNTDKTNFVYETRNFSTATGIVDFYFGDFNNDGALDVAYTSGGLKILINKVPQLSSNVKDIQTNLKVYPNPSKDLIFVEGTDGSGNIAHFYNQVGMLVHEAAVQDGQIDISSLISGPYVITILDASGKVLGRSKMVKE